MNQDLNKWLLLIPLFLLLSGWITIVYSQEISDFVCNNLFSCVGKEYVNCLTIDNISNCVFEN